MKQLFTKFKNSLLESNHWKHLIGGCLVYILIRLVSNPISAMFSTAIVASCLEFKDKLYGNRFDFIDWIYTVGLPILLVLIEFLIQLF